MPNTNRRAHQLETAKTRLPVRAFLALAINYHSRISVEEIRENLSRWGTIGITLKNTFRFLHSSSIILANIRWYATDSIPTFLTLLLIAIANSFSIKSKTPHLERK